MKTCSKCKEEKEASLKFFTKNSCGKNGLRSWCRSCQYKDNRAKAIINKDRWADGVRNKELKKKYGITLETYNSMLSNQGGKCKICETNTPNRGNKHFSVDHCHVTGKVRGLLCSACNTLVGIVEANKIDTENVKSYLATNE